MDHLHYYTCMSFTNNNGLKYERYLSDLFGVSYAGAASNRPDLVIEGVGIEVKCSPNAGYGQLSVTEKTGQWDFTTRSRSRVLLAAARESKIIDQIRLNWGDGGKSECKTYVGAKVVRRYYKEKVCDYIQIKGRGFFRLGIADPWNLGVPMFNPEGVFFRARRSKYGGRGTYMSTLELRIEKCPLSPVDIEDLT